MSVFKRPDAETYSYDFKIKGRRFSGNTGAKTAKDAEAIEKRLKIKAREDIETEERTGSGPMLLRHAAGRYWQEVGQDHADKEATHRDLQRLVEFFGPDKRIDEIGDAEVASLVAWRRNQTLKGRAKSKDGTPVPKVSPATVNRSVLEPLRKVLTRAKAVWRCSLPREPNWRAHRLKEPEGRTRELKAQEETEVFEAAREDYLPWVRFTLMTGLRRRETLIKWSNVDWGSGVITTVGKRKRLVTTPITPAVAELLRQQEGHHPDFVFTFEAKRTGKFVVRGRPFEYVKGKRYPITYEGGKTEWKRLITRADVKDFRYHDLRHTTATRLLRKTGNLALVRKALNHADITTTARYAHVVQDEVAAALQELSQSHEKSHGAKKKLG